MRRRGWYDDCPQSLVRVPRKCPRSKPLGRTRRVKFHVEHNVTPEHVSAILHCLEAQSLVSEESVLSALAARSHRIHPDHLRRNLVVLEVLGLVEEETRFYRLSDWGEAARRLATFHRGVFFDLVHFLLYSSWDRRQIYWSWTYQTVCQLLWEARPRIETYRELVGDVAGVGSRCFPGRRLVIDESSIGAVVRWLHCLDPRFIHPSENNNREWTAGREWVSPDLVVLAIQYLYESLNVSWRTPLLLDQAKLTRLGPLLLAEETTCLSSVRVASSTFSILQEHSGEWGSSVIMARGVRPGDLV